MKDLPITRAAVAADAACCRDCGAPVAGNYCAHCGQETLIETPTVRQFLHELADQYVAMEGKLGRTLRVLVAQPGQLTLDYLEGRRQRYVRPLKLYLSISVVFFGLLGILPDSISPFVNTDPEAEKEARQALQEQMQDQQDDDDAPAKTAPSAAAPPAAAPAANAPVANAPAAASAPAAAPAQDDANLTLKQQIDREIAESEKSGDAKNLDKKIERDVNQHVSKEVGAKAGLIDKAKGFSKLSSKEQGHLLRAKLADEAPYAMFFLLPYFALLLSWLYRKNGLRYGAHLLFSIHLHCFAFILLVFGFLPLPSLLRTGLWMGLVAYLFLALRRAYGGTVKRTAWREALLLGLYMIAVAASTVSGVLSAVLGGGSS